MSIAFRTAMTGPSETAPSPGNVSPLLSAEGVGLEVGGHVLLKDVSLAVAPAETVMLIGPNGAGKTTLLRVLLGLARPTAGRVRHRAGLEVGYVPQRLTMDPVLPLSVRRLMTLTRRAPRRAVLRALEETGVAHRADTAVADLSGGEFRRVLLARVLLREPALLVLDEPVQGVDYQGEAALYELIGRIGRERGCAVLMVSHDLHVVMAAADRVVCLNRTICCAGAPRSVARDPAYSRLFGSHAAAFAVYDHAHHDADGHRHHAHDA